MVGSQGKSRKQGTIFINFSIEELKIAYANSSVQN